MAEQQTRSPIDHVEVLAAEGSALIAAVNEGPRELPVAACPGWDLTALAGHIGKTWRWCARVVNERVSAPIQLPDDPSPSADEAVAYLQDALVDLLDALRSCPEGTALWGFGLHPRTEAFWRRRMAMETVVHRVDVELAIGRFSPVEATVAADGIGEFVDVLLPRLYRGQASPSGQLSLASTDTGDAWTVGDPAEGVGTLQGTAPDLFLGLWQRQGGGALASGGDMSVVAGWRALGAP